MGANQRASAYAHIRAELPELAPLIAVTGEVDLPEASSEPVADVLVRIVAGQMLSRSAAQSILARMNEVAGRGGCGKLYRLSEPDLRACGLSGRKASTIGLIADMAEKQPGYLESWRALPFDQLRSEVAKVWGLSDWSASVLAIFHFGHADVFPLSDGSLVRAIKLVEERVVHHADQLNYQAAAPFRSYLALTLWAALDNGHLARGARSK